MMEAGGERHLSQQPPILQQQPQLRRNRSQLIGILELNLNNQQELQGLWCHRLLNPSQLVLPELWFHQLPNLIQE